MFKSLRKSMKALSRELSALMEVPDETGQQSAVAPRRPAAPTPPPAAAPPGVQLLLPLEYAPGTAPAAEPEPPEPELAIAAPAPLPVALTRPHRHRSPDGQLLGALEAELGGMEFLAGIEAVDLWETLDSELVAVPAPDRAGTEPMTLWRSLSAELDCRQLPLPTGDLSAALDWELSGLNGETEAN